MVVIQGSQRSWEPIYSYIPSTPSLLTILSRSLERITADVNSLDIAAIGGNIESITSNLNLSVVHIAQITQEAADISADVTANIHESSSNFTMMVSDLRQSVQNSDTDVTQTLSNLRYITEETRELIHMIKRSPSMLLTEPPKKKLSR